MIYRLAIYRIAILYNHIPKYASVILKLNIHFFELKNHINFLNNLLKYRNIRLYFERNDTYDN